MSVLSEQTVIEAVKKHLNGHHPGGATLEIISNGIRRDQEWWYVPIRPSIQPNHRYEYYETLAKIEKDVERSEHITVLLVPVVPDEE